MIGHYENFPENIHRIVTVNFSLPVRNIQEKVIQTLYDMNQKMATSEEVDNQALRGCDVVFETGVAESGSFSFLDRVEVTKFLGVIKKTPLGIIDILIAACYYRMNGEKKSPLKFDYFLVRTVFLEKSLELRVFHERGPRYISPEDIGKLLIERTNRLATRKILKSL